MKKILSTATFIVLSLSIVSCGKYFNKLISDIMVDARDEDSIKYVTADFKVDIGRAELPNLNFPLPQDYGVFSLYRVDGENHVAFDLNFTEILKLPAGTATLPNGELVPLNTSSAGIIEIPIAGINGKIYISKVDDMTLIGFAFSIKQLDGLGSRIGTLRFFRSFDIGDIELTAGIYTSNQPNGTGIAAFADLGAIWTAQGDKITQNTNDTSPFVFTSQRASSWQYKSFLRQINILRNTKQVLVIE